MSPALGLLFVWVYKYFFVCSYSVHDDVMGSTSSLVSLSLTVV